MVDQDCTLHTSMLRRQKRLFLGCPVCHAMLPRSPLPLQVSSPGLQILRQAL
jgi:hypothetical protein